MKDTVKQHTARAGSVLVFGSDKAKRGFITSIVVRSIDPGKRLVFTGPVSFEAKTQNHVEQVILPIVDDITDSLGLEKCGFEISAENLSAASALDTGIDIGGFSADVSVLMAMLAACLGIELPRDCVFTGHIASVSGNITEVSSLDIKAKCARSQKQIRKFVCPAVSFETLSVDQQVTNFHTVVSDGSLEIIEVKNVSEVFSRVISEKQVITSALQNGYYHRDRIDSGDNNILSFLIDDLEERFYRYLEQVLLNGDAKSASQILNRFADSYIRRKVYPKDFGSQLFTILCSVPTFLLPQIFKATPMTRDRILRLQSYAKEKDFEDVALMLDCVRGKLARLQQPTTEKATTEHPQDSNARDFDLFVQTLSRKSFADKWGKDIDHGRASFKLPVTVVSNCQEFISIVEALYIHLVSNLTRTIVNPQQSVLLKQEALILLEDAFRREGGFDQAFAMARDGTHNGLRGVLDQMTDRYKERRYEVFVTDGFTRALKQRDFGKRLEFIKAAVLRLKPFLPSQCHNWPPERFATHIEYIIKAYIQSVDQFAEITARF